MCCRNGLREVIKDKIGYFFFLPKKCLHYISLMILFIYKENKNVFIEKVIILKKVTIKEVAKAAGVSISTVSNALNDVDVLNPKTKAHILETARKLNYVPNLNGKLLKSGKSNIIGFVTPSVEGPYFYRLVESMARECEKNNYSLNVVVTQDEKVVLNSVLGGRFDGVVVFDRVHVGETEVAQIDKEHVKVVFLDREYHSETSTSVLFDSFEQGYAATQYLISLGHKKIGFISGHETMYDGLERKRGYMQAMRDAELFVEQEMLLHGLFEEEATYNVIRSSLNQNRELPTAFLAANDLSAIGCIKALHSKGINVPEEISVMGFDDIDIAAYFSPPLTTVSNPIHEQGRIAIQELLRIIEGEHANSVRILNGELIIRKSCYISKT